MEVTWLLLGCCAAVHVVMLITYIQVTTKGDNPALSGEYNRIVVLTLRLRILDLLCPKNKVSLFSLASLTIHFETSFHKIGPKPFLRLLILQPSTLSMGFFTHPHPKVKSWIRHWLHIDLHKQSVPLFTTRKNCSSLCWCLSICENGNTH